MLEDIVRGIGLPVDNVLRLQSPQSRTSIVGPFENEGKQARVKASADRRRRLQQRPVSAAAADPFWR